MRKVYHSKILMHGLHDTSRMLPGQGGTPIVPGLFSERLADPRVDRDSRSRCGAHESQCDKLCRSSDSLGHLIQTYAFQRECISFLDKGKEVLAYYVH